MATMAIPVQQFEITLEENAVLSDIKRALKMIKGIASVRVVNKQKTTRLNATTIKAIEDVRSGKTYKASSVDNLLTQCLD